MMGARFEIAILCFAGAAAAARAYISTSVDVAYATACRNYDARDTTLTLAGATALVRDYASRVNLTCGTTLTCERCFNLTRLDGMATSLLDQDHFRAVAAWLLLASWQGDAGANSTSRWGDTRCPYSGTGIIDSTRPMDDLIGVYRSGGSTAGEQLKKFLSALKNVDRGVSSCFSANSLFAGLGISNDTVSVSDEQVAQLLSYAFIHMVRGHAVLDDCPTQPVEQQIILDLLQLLGVHDTNISLQDLSRVVQKLTAGSNDSTANEPGAASLGQSFKPAQMCLNAVQLLSAYGFDSIDNNTSISVDQLLVMSPALLQQRLGGYCSESTAVAELLIDTQPSPAETYGYGTLAVLVISLLPLLGILLLPCMTTRAADLILTLFTALAIGTMLSDALMHILPEILKETSEEEGQVSENIMKTLTTFLGIYLLFLLEILLHMARKKMSALKVTSEGIVPDHGHGHSHGIGHGHSHFDATDFGLTSSTKSISTENAVTGRGASSSDVSRRTGCCVGYCSNIKPFAVVVIVGDLLHNFTDGLSVGAGFATSVRLGVSLAIAVCCHEVPHEIGNFAVLLSAGIKKWKVLGLSLFSTSSCFVGFYIGASVGSNERAADFIFAITAATFFYVALVDLLPNVIQKSSPTPFLHFLMINIGLSLGFAIMLVFAVYEELITI